MNTLKDAAETDARSALAASDSTIPELPTPTCDKCHAPVDTGLMVAFCPHRETCAFWEDTWDDEIKAFVRRMWEPEASVRCTRSR